MGGFSFIALKFIWFKHLVADDLPMGRKVYPGANEASSFIYELTRNVYDPEQLMSTAFRSMRPFRPHSYLLILNLP
jgi:hypothetical protein